MNRPAVPGFALQGAGGSAGFGRGFQFEGGIAVEANAAIPVARGLEIQFAEAIPDNGCAPEIDVREEEPTLGGAFDAASAGQISQFVLSSR